MENRLKHASSPYLRAHKDNPINWHEWGEEAFTEARERDVPVFLSIGYTTCHWCHVMNRESFMDSEVADLLNAHFVAIKLDREERPDIDHLYMEACTAISGQGGWPLSAFLSHDKSPFFAGTYFPRDGFIQLLESVRDMWRGDRARLTGAGGEFLSFLSQPLPARDIRRHECIEAGVRGLAEGYDEVYGGFMPAPKFPALQRLLFLLRHGEIHGGESGKMVAGTLSGMASGGIYDHVGGGFFRYSTDERWHIPHYEKMLYDNAMALLTYAEAAVALKNRHFGQIAKETVQFVRRELGAEGGGFYTALDADSPGGEGAFYLWTREQVIEALGPEVGEEFCLQFDVGDTPSLPNRIGRGESTMQGDVTSLLYEYRQKRERPMRDEKILASSNALFAAALAAAGRLLREPEWTSMAEGICDFILENLCLDGRLKASCYGGRAEHKATLDDYAYFVWALIELYQSTFDPKWLGLALNWNAHLMELFGGTGGGFFLSGRDVTDLPLRQKVYLDGPVPSGNSVACMNLIRLHALTRDESYLEAAEGILSAAMGTVSRYPTSCAGLLSAILLMGNVGTLTISHGEGRGTLVDATVGYYPFLQVAVVGGEGDGTGPVDRMVPSATDSPPVDGHAAGYYCDRMGCHRPVTDEEILRELLGQGK